jgi:integrase/recombinase XerD
MIFILSGGYVSLAVAWEIYIQEYENYLKLERSLSQNSVEAYVHDVVKLKQFLEISNRQLTPLQVVIKDLLNTSTKLA